MNRNRKQKSTQKMPREFMADIRRVYEQAIAQHTQPDKKQPQEQPDGERNG